MARQPINIGSSGNDGTGDKLRISFDKINQNFGEVYFDVSNTNSRINNVSIIANTALDTAINAFDSSNTSFNIVSGAFNNLSNTVVDVSNVANAAFDKANTINTFNVIKIDDGVHEVFQTKSDATGIVIHNCSEGHIIYHTSPDANWTVNLTNLNLSSSYVTTISLIISQGGTGYYANTLQINGVAQTINWQGNTTPNVSVNRIDVETFSIINNSGTYIVLGQVAGF